MSYVCGGEVAERSIASVLKTDVLQGTGGSNPSFSAVVANSEKKKTAKLIKTP